MALAVINLDRSSSIPLYHQLYEQIRQAIASEQLKTGFRLPSTRGLASSLGVSRNTVASAFEQLLAEGYIEGRVGAGTYVTGQAGVFTLERDRAITSSRDISSHSLSQQGLKMLAMRETIFRYRYEQVRAFRPGVPALEEFPVEVWSKLMAQHWRCTQPELLGYGDPCGYRPLRECIAAYLQSSRATFCQPEQVIIVSGSQQALDITARVLIDPGDDVWMEDPGYLGARNAFLGASANVVPLSVDRQGIKFDAETQKSA